MLRLTLYTKDGRTSCEMLKIQLRMFQRLYPHKLTEVDIASDALLGTVNWNDPH